MWDNGITNKLFKLRNNYKATIVKLQKQPIWERNTYFRGETRVTADTENNKCLATMEDIDRDWFVRFLL